MIPIHKKDKDKTEADSYRPISLTSCIVKHEATSVTFFFFSSSLHETERLVSYCFWGPACHEGQIRTTVV